MKRILFSMVCIFLIPAIFAQAGTADKNAQLIQAAKKGNLTDVQTALTDGADINATVVKKYYGFMTKEVTALIVASPFGHTEIVKLLLDRGADVNVKTNEGSTALVGASYKGHMEVIKLLLNKGADVNAKRTPERETALWLASRNGHAEIVKLLLAKGAKVNVKNSKGETALKIAKIKGHKEIVEILEKAGAKE